MSARWAEDEGRPCILKGIDCIRSLALSLSPRLPLVRWGNMSRILTNVVFLYILIFISLFAILVCDFMSELTLYLSLSTETKSLVVYSVFFFLSPHLLPLN